MHEEIFKDNGLLKWADEIEEAMALQQKSMNIPVNSSKHSPLF